MLHKFSVLRNHPLFRSLSRQNKPPINLMKQMCYLTPAHDLLVRADDYLIRDPLPEKYSVVSRDQRPGSGTGLSMKNNNKVLSGNG